MSLTTIAAPVTALEPAPARPPSEPERFLRSDFIAAALVFLTTLGVYIATLAPNVTLEDSGELITAATKFGVAHPPGYPFWTLSGFIFSHLFPFGNLAWRINLLSALFGAAASGVLTLLVCHSGRWLLQRWVDGTAQATMRPLCFYAGIFAGLTIGFSDVMWRQAVIAAVHGTLNALFLNLLLLTFYLWLLEPQKTERLIVMVFVYGLGLTNHHTLIQLIPAVLIAAFLLRAGKFWSVFLGMTLFGLSVLIYVSWLSGDRELQEITTKLGLILLIVTALIAFFYLQAFRLRWFVAGVLIALLVFGYGNYLMGPGHPGAPRVLSPDHFWQWGNFLSPGWLQLTTSWGWAMLALTALALGLLLTSQLDRRLILGVFVAGWVGLTPYAYEGIASDTNPPMNWGFTAERAGFYYAVSREQYPMSLPNLIKDTIGKAVGIVPPDVQKDASIGRPDYFKRLWLTFYYYGDNLQANFTVPLIVLTLAVLLFLRRCDWPQVTWFIFLAAAFFFLGFMLQLIEPQEGFDFERNLQFRVFHVLSHCIFVILVGYGALAAMVYIRETWPELTVRTGVAGLGLPCLFLALLPFCSNLERCDQSGHWFGYDFGADIMRPLDRNAVYLGGSDPGRFVPTYMAFVESQQPDRWKRDPSFDRRDVTVITQNALCDTFYAHYIRYQYDPRFRPPPASYNAFERWLGRDKAYPQKPVTCFTEGEFNACWAEYEARPEVAARLKSGGALLRPGTNDVFDVNGIFAWHLFQRNKKSHTFYLEQSTAIDWMYPYMVPSGLIFKLNPEPLAALPPAAIAADREFWDAYSAKLLQNPRFRIDDAATLNFAKLAFWHSDLYRWRNLPAEQEHWLRMALALCPQLQTAVSDLARLLALQKRFDEAIALLQQAELDDPRNDTYPAMLDGLLVGQKFSLREAELRRELGVSPKAAYDVALNLQLASLLENEGKYDELYSRMRFIAGLTNWDRGGMASIMQYYVDQVHDPEAAIAFLEVRARIDPKASEMVYSLAAEHAALGHKDAAIKYLTQAVSVGGTNALISARIDPRFQDLHDDPRFQNLIHAEAVQPLTPGGSGKKVSQPK